MARVSILTEHWQNTANLQEFFCFVLLFVLESPHHASFLFYKEILELHEKNLKNNKQKQFGQ